jgi:hypothetical protein
VPLTHMLQCDLIDNREVSYLEGRDLALSFGVPFFESSAKSRINVEEAFYELVRGLFLFGGPCRAFFFSSCCRRRFMQVREFRRQTAAKPTSDCSILPSSPLSKNPCMMQQLPSPRAASHASGAPPTRAANTPNPLMQIYCPEPSNANITPQTL